MDAVNGLEGKNSAEHMLPAQDGESWKGTPHYRTLKCSSPGGGVTLDTFHEANKMESVPISTIRHTEFSHKHTSLCNCLY